MRFFRSVITAFLVLVWLATAAAAATAQAPEDKALGRPAIASSVEPAREGGLCSEVLCAPGNASDGRDDTRWSSAFSDTAWWQVDLGRARQVDSIALTWHVARAQRYRIATSLDGADFVPAANVTLSLSPGQLAELAASERHTETTRFGARSARYVRVTSLERAPVFRDGTAWLAGVSLWTASVFGPVDDGQSATGLEVVSGMIRPFPVVRIKGRVTPDGVDLDLLSVKAPADATIRVRCRGRSCPPRARRRARLKGKLPRVLAAGTVVTVLVTRPGNYGKYTRFVIRRGRAPARTDRCLRGSSRRPVSCPAA